MGKSVHPLVLDAALSFIRAQATAMVVVEGQPATYQSAEGEALATALVVPNDFAIADGQLSGRRLAITAKSGLSVDGAGTANHIALIDQNNETLLYVTTCAPQALLAGSTVNISGWSVEIQDPA